MNIINLQSTITFSGNSTVTGNKYKGIGYYGSAASTTTLVYAAGPTFRGTLTTQGTLERNPSESDWFDIDSVTVDSGDSSLARTIVKSGQFVWLRSKITDFTAGTVSFINASYSIVSGEQGIQGTQGIQGREGTQGIQGTTGEQGIQGIQGTTGQQGIQGIQGTQGLQGIQGIQGPIGPENFEIDGGNASTIYTAEIEIDGGNANG